MEDKYQIYETILGDTWDSIAYKLYENSKLYKHLFDWNQEYISTVIFKAGIKIKYKKINKQLENLPPWR